MEKEIKGVRGSFMIKRPISVRLGWTQKQILLNTKFKKNREKEKTEKIKTKK